MSKRARFSINESDNTIDEKLETENQQVEIGDEKQSQDLQCDEFYDNHTTNEDEPQASSSNERFINVRSSLLPTVDPNLSLREVMRKQARPINNGGFIDYTQTRYYDRYKQQEYTRRNDYMKYCHVCRKKTIGKLRVLPGDLRMRKVWILRSNLDEGRSAELWLRELACEGSHGGEFCEAHFPPGSNHLKGSQLFPIDVRPLEGRHSILEDILFDFDSMYLECVFCSRKNSLSSMLPFIRNRAKRSRWIDILSDGDVDFKRRLQQNLRGGVTKFLCDWHISDSSFEINGFGEWRLLKNAVPDPHLTEQDKRGLRIYLVDKCRDPIFWDRHMWREMDQVLQSNELGDHDQLEVNDELDTYLDERDHTILMAKPLETRVKIEELEINQHDHHNIVEREVVIEKCESEPSTSDINLEIEFSDDSDEENEMIEKIGEIPYSERLCQVCSRIEPIGSEFPFKSIIRTWPFDEYRHKKWLEIMDWPSDFEESMKTLWQKRKTEGSLTDSYHFCPINVCQSHLDFRKLPEKMDQWLKTFCVLCDSCMSSENLVVPLPPNLHLRKKWISSLLPVDSPNRLHFKKVNWLRSRLLRPKATRYRLCVYHFASDSFVNRTDGTIKLRKDALPLPMGGEDFDETPRGPNSVCKCFLCDDWKKQDDMALLRYPTMESEKTFLADCLLNADKGVIKKTLVAISRNQKEILICANHFPEKQDPFSIIAERRLLYGTEAECVLCSHIDDCTAMIPFPTEDEPELRKRWVHSMCREPWLHHYVLQRLSKNGRHYLCSSHFSRNSLKFHNGLGLWRKAGTTPILSCTSEEERQIVWDLNRENHPYHPLLLEPIDNDRIAPIDYDQVVEILGNDRLVEIENELNSICQNMRLKIREEIILEELAAKQNEGHGKLHAEQIGQIYGVQIRNEQIVEDDTIVYQEEQEEANDL